MRASAKQNVQDAPPGVIATARVGRRATTLAPRLRRGDVAVLDHADLDRASAQALLDAGVVAVVNAAPFISGRYPNLGPELLAQAGVELVDQLGTDGLAAVRDGARVRLHEGIVYDEAGAPLTGGRPVGLEEVAAEMAAARSGLVAQLDSFTHNTTEFLRREQDLLLHGEGAPTLSTRLAGRPVVAVVHAHDHRTELAQVATYVREQRPVLIGVDRGADALLAAGLRPDVVVVTGQHGLVEHDAVSAKALKAARDVVLVLDRGTQRRSIDQLDRLGIRPARFETGATAEDAALMLAHLNGAEVIVGVGMHATLDEFLDSRRDGLASTYLTRLVVGPRLVDARAVPSLYSGVVRPRHLVLLVLAGLLALAAAVGITPAGQDWADHLASAGADLLDHIQGLFS